MAESLRVDRDREALLEIPLVDIAYQILSQGKEPYYYRDLMAKVAELRGLTQDEVDVVIARLYTDINIDVRFVCIGDNVWGLRSWYPLDKATERGAGKRFVRKEVLDFDDEEDEEIAELDEELLDEEPPYTFGDDDAPFADEEDEIDAEADFIEEGPEIEEEVDVEDDAEDEDVF
ncbi:DNA-directed RNA polymerase subunit delta [Ferroacidibacillus organovorans]|uniref:Probable DNA-directed RNA polymerase subunit delta n=1 Tax=Ferroacidibacillus organovorans TaxID=1765683 RepID=A0A101XPX9_9BACL|nr:DNA-directed RNA polymerase subunit delta [Ferroacidibacillus organovorans]KUO95289.1 hypothetical protein ATW55_14260 [Ferroacidibacillus organovorans]